MASLTIDPEQGGRTKSPLAGNGFEFGIIEERVDVGGAAQVFSLSQKLPANSVVLSWEMMNADAITLATATAYSLGTSSDPNALGESSTTMTVNTKHFGGPASTAVFAAETGLRLTSTNGSGAAAGTFNGTDEQIWVRVFFIKMPAWHNKP